MSMQELKVAVDALSEDQYAEFRKWLAERDEDAWDAQMAEDAAAGRLDWVAREAEEALALGTTQPL